MNYAVKTERAKTEKYVDSASKGMKDCTLTSYQNVLNSKDCDKVVFMGVLRGSNLIYKWAEKNKKDFYYIDRPYWGESRATPYWMRCVKNQHVKTFTDTRPDDRFKQQFKDEIKPYHKNGQYVLVVPPSHAMAEHFNAHDWLQKTIDVLKANTDRELVIREKPYNPEAVVDATGKMTPGKSSNNKPPRPFEWHKVHAVVTFNSSISIKALTNGVPVFANFDNPCLPVCEQDFTKIENPNYEDPRPVFYSLAYGQFTQQEFRNGYYMEILDGR